MKKALLLCLFGAFALVSACNKDKKTCDPVTAKALNTEVTALEQYLTSRSITATKDDRGFYYSITTPGTGDTPSSCSDVTVKYKGQRTDNFVFDENTTGISFNLSQLILGWQEGIPLIAEGGKIILYLPPSLAYGEQAQQNIPANSILIFTIELLAVN